MNSELPPEASPADPNRADLSSSDKGKQVAEPGPNKVWLLAVAFGVALLFAAALLLVGLGKL